MLLRKHFPNIKFSKALSIGCGNGYKEIMLIEEGLVDNFELFELSTKAIEIGKKKLKKLELKIKLLLIILIHSKPILSIKNMI